METPNALAIAVAPDAAPDAHSSNSNDPTAVSPTAVQPQGVTRTTPTGFLDLSAELRNQIYELALVDSRPLKIRNRNYGRRFGLDGHASKTADFETWAVESRGTEGAYNLLKTSVNIKLLQANRQINSEAAPIFYGQNCFVVDFEDVLQCFSSSIASQVRHLKFSGGNSYRRDLNHLRSTLAKLRKCGSLQLQMIEFEHSTLTTFSQGGRTLDHTQVAKILLPFMRDMIKSRGTEAFETFNLYLGTTIGYTERGKAAKRLQVAADTKVIKEKLADILKAQKIKAEAGREAKLKLKGNKKTESILEFPFSW